MSLYQGINLSVNRRNIMSIHLLFLITLTFRVLSTAHCSLNSITLSQQNSGVSSLSEQQAIIPSQVDAALDVDPDSREIRGDLEAPDLETSEDHITNLDCITYEPLVDPVFVNKSHDDILIKGDRAYFNRSTLQRIYIEERKKSRDFRIRMKHPCNNLYFFEKDVLADEKKKAEVADVYKKMNRQKEYDEACLIERQKKSRNTDLRGAAIIEELIRGALLSQESSQTAFQESSQTASQELSLFSSQESSPTASQEPQNPQHSRNFHQALRTCYRSTCCAGTLAVLEFLGALIKVSLLIILCAFLLVLAFRTTW